VVPVPDAGVKSACQCPKLKELIEAIITKALEARPGAQCDVSELLAELQEIKAKLDAIADAPQVDNDWIEARLDLLESTLTAIDAKLDNAGTTQEQVATAIGAMAVAQVGTIDKLDAAIALLHAVNTRPIAVTLTVQSSSNLPASYVDTSTIWAVQRESGISHAVLVVNSDDPEWDRLEPEYVRAQHKFPAMQLVDVKSTQLKISPTPQLVLYYLEEGRQPEVISGDRNVGAKLRDFYSN